MDTNLVITLIEKYVHGRISPIELEMLREWFYSTTPEEFQRNLQRSNIPMEYKNIPSGSSEFSHALELRLNSLIQENSFSNQENAASDIISQKSFHDGKLQQGSGNPDLNLELTDTHPQNSRLKSVYLTRILKMTWFKYSAAALVLIFSILAYIGQNDKNNIRLDETIVENLTTENISPGGQRAILVLADGTEIVLDSVADGSLAQQGNARIMKMGRGQITYKVEGASGEVLWNTMRTPLGGQYQVSLPDGTRVWLNAGSSITYPTAFVDKYRIVKVSGEAFFEVIRNKHKPFIVDIDGRTTVQVLGTSFNINSYPNEGSVKTTLIEGIVKVVDEIFNHPSDRNNNFPVVLKPRQQAQVSPKGIQVKTNVDIDQTLAWKNGMFDFNDADLRSVMRQLERWYDIEVKYEGNVPNHVFKGRMYRNVNLNDLLEVFKKMGVNFRVSGRTLVIKEI